MTHLYSYKPASKSGKDLADALGIRRIRHTNSRFVGSPSKTVINWGSSNLPPSVRLCNVLNSESAVGICANKRTFFRHVEEVENLNIPDYTEEQREAYRWIEAGDVVVCRTKLTGNSGDGIVVATTSEEVVEAPLYTKYIKKNDEYRVHVMNGEVFLVQRKARKRDVPDEEVDWKIRNLAGGFIFARNEDNHSYPMLVREQALLAFNATGLDFGSVDIIYNGHQNRAYVLEVNTASGLAGTTLTDYVTKFREHYNV